MASNLKYHFLTPTGLSTIAFLLYAAPVFPATITQRTEGSCSPTVADVRGNVNIECKGIDEKIAADIIKMLNEILQDTRKLELIRQDLDKIGKRTEEIEARQASRRLTQNQARQLVMLLAGKSDGNYVEISAIANNDEAMQFAQDIGGTLLAAGWKAEGIGWSTVLGVNPVGVQIWIRNPTNPSPGARVLIESFRQIGLNVIIREAGNNLPDNRIGLWIANKP